MQVVPHVPHGPGDERVDAIVTEAETIRCPPRGAAEPHTSTGDHDTATTGSQERGP